MNDAESLNPFKNANVTGALTKTLSVLRSNSIPISATSLFHEADEIANKLSSLLAASAPTLGNFDASFRGYRYRIGSIAASLIRESSEPNCDVFLLNHCRLSDRF